MMNADRNNLHVVTIAAWPDWKTKSGVFRKSAVKQGVAVTVLDAGAAWLGFYRHKIVGLLRYLTDLRRNDPIVRYVLFSDCRDAVFIKGTESIIDAMKRFDDEKVVFSVGKTMRSWPLTSIWFAERISLCYGRDGILNSGGFVGRIDRLIALLNACVAIRQELRTERADPRGDLVGRILADRPTMGRYAARCLEDDQFLLQCLQARWSDLIAVDRERKLFALFDGGYPPLRTAPHLLPGGTMPLGEAAVLHSPWMILRDDQTWDKTVRWKEWALREAIIDP